MITDAKARAARPREKKYALTDLNGLHLEVLTSGRKVWRFRFTREGKRSWLTLGDYPALSLEVARERASVLKQRLKDGLSLEVADKEKNRFKVVANEWAADHDSRLSTDKEKRRVRERLRKHVLPYLGDLDITKIEPPDVLAVLRRLASEGKFEMMTRIRSMISMIFRFAAANGLPVNDPTAVLRGAITAPPAKHYSSIRDNAEIARFLRAIDAYPSDLIRAALKFSAYTFCRPGEIRHAEWAEIDLDNAEWKIPAEKMKMRRPHIVPLSRQAVEILEGLRPHTGEGRYVFPSARTPNGSRPMSDAAVLAAIRSMGYDKTQMTAHGFRSMASTILNEQGFNRDWIERQLAHVEGNQVRAAYNYAEHLKERREMMQTYADFLDALKNKEMTQ